MKCHIDSDRIGLSKNRKKKFFNRLLFIKQSVQVFYYYNLLDLKILLKYGIKVHILEAVIIFCAVYVKLSVLNIFLQTR